MVRHPNVHVVFLLVLSLKNIIKEQLIDMEELGIPPIVSSTKESVLLPIREAKTVSLFSVQWKTFGCKIPKHMKQKFSATQLCHRKCNTPSRLGSTKIFPLIYEVYLSPKYLKRIAKKQAHILHKSKAPLDFEIHPLFCSFFFFF